MTAEQALNTALLAATALTNLVSTRIYPVEAPTGATMPYLVYQRISTQPDVTHDQSSASSKHIDGVHFQLTAIAATLLAAATIIYQARLAVERAATLTAVWTDERTLARDEAAQAFGHSADFLVWRDPD